MRLASIGLALLFLCNALLLNSTVAVSESIQGTVMIKTTSPTPATRPFAPHPGWVSFYPADESAAVTARIGDDARFSMERPAKPGTVIVMFDQIETPPIIIPKWPNTSAAPIGIPSTRRNKAGGSNYDIIIEPDYAVYPEGYPDVWDRQYRKSDITLYQTFVAKSHYLSNATTFDATRAVWWGSKVRFSVVKGDTRGDVARIHADDGEGFSDFMSAQHTHWAAPRAGWRPGDIILQPGSTYALRIQGYRSHGNESFNAPLFVCNNDKEGYAQGEAFMHDHSPAGGDLCLLLWGDANGQVVENQIRTEEWEIDIPKRPPVRNWGESFLSHGRSFAGVAFWSGNPGDKSVTCTVKIRKGGPGGEIIGPERIATGVESPTRPIIRYPDYPGQLPGYESQYKPPYRLFQAAWAPDEVRLEPGEHYYIDIEASEPVMLFYNGDIDPNGHAYYNGEKITRDMQKETFHSQYWNLAMAIVTWQNKGGKPNNYRPDAVIPDNDGNLVMNGGAEAGDLRGWKIEGAVEVNPDREFPDPWHYLGVNHFGCFMDNKAGEAVQYQEITGLVPGASYEASFMACHADGSGEVIELLWSDGKYGQPERAITRTAEPKRQWLRYAGSFKPTSKSGTLIIRYRHESEKGRATMHVDEVKVKRVK